MKTRFFSRFLAVAAIFIAHAATAAQGIPLNIDSIPWRAATPLVDETAPFAELKITDVHPTTLFINDSGTLCQLVIVSIENASKGAANGKLKISSPETAENVLKEISLHAGRNDVLFPLPDFRQPRTIEIELSQGGQFQQRLVFDWKAAKQWKVYVVQTSHFDYGYTGTQQEVMEKWVKILDDVLNYCAQTDDWPEESKFRWMIESSFCLNHYLEVHPEKEGEIRRRISEGRIEIGANYAHMHSSTEGHEELVRNLYNSTVKLSKLFDVDIVTAVHTDVDGITWGEVTAWTGAGVRYFSFNPNFFYRGGNILHQTQTPQAYYWVGASGKKILTWRSKNAYSEAGFLIEGLDSTMNQLPALLQSYENEGYPYDAIHLTQTGLDEIGLLDISDNASPRFEICDTVRQWNEIFEYPKLICATSSQFFSYLEENFADKIPEFRGDCTDWWADGVLTGSVAEGQVRRLHHKLSEAEVLSSAASIINSNSAYPRADLEQAWENTLLFDEHTWGFMFPFLSKQAEIWKKKVDDMQSADAICNDITKQKILDVTKKIKGEGWKLFVFNALSWNRDDIVSWQPPPDFPQDYLGSDYFRILDAKGEEVPYQIVSLDDGTREIVFIAEDVPATGYTTYNVVPAESQPAFQGAVSTTADGIKNEYYQITFDPNSGITSIYDLKQKRELVDKTASYHVNEFISRKQGLFDQYDTRTSGLITNFHIKEVGPVYASAVYETADPDNPACKIIQEIRLYSGLKKIDFINRVDDFANQLGQSKYFTFPFNVPNFEFHIDIPNAVMRPFYEQLPDFAKYYAIQHWVDVSNPQENFGISWATMEGPMVELGEITKKASWTSNTPPLNYDPGEYPYEPKFSHIYSEVMNNFQNTNFNYHQEGSGTWRYSMMSHKGSWDQFIVTQFGWDISSPLLVELFKADSKGYLPDSLSFFRVDKENVKILTVKAAESGEGFIIRLFENLGKPTTVKLESPILTNIRASLTDLAERKKEELTCKDNSVAVDIGPFGLATVHVEGDPAYPSKDNEGVSEFGCGCW